MFFRYKIAGAVSSIIISIVIITGIIMRVCLCNFECWQLEKKSLSPSDGKSTQAYEKLKQGKK